MKRIKRLLAFILAFVIIIPSVLPALAIAEEIPTDQRDLTKRTGLKPFEIHYLSEDDLSTDDICEKKVIDSSAYGTGKNSEWAEYSTYFYYNQMIGHY